MTLRRTLLVLSLMLVPALAMGDGKEVERGSVERGAQEKGKATDPAAAPSTLHSPPSTPSPSGPVPPAAAPRPTSQTGGSQSGYLPYQEPALPDSPGLLTVAGRVVGSLALVVGLIFVTAVGLRRFLGGKKTPVTSRKVTELVEVTPLGGKRYLYLIRVADRLLVVGSGGERLELLTEISDPLVLAAVAAMPRQSQFFELFHRLRAKEAPAAEQFPAQC